MQYATRMTLALALVALVAVAAAAFGSQGSFERRVAGQRPEKPGFAREGKHERVPGLRGGRFGAMKRRMEKS